MHPKIDDSVRPEWPSHCVWCNSEFAHIIELLAHVDELHLTTTGAPPAA
jgi:hypothetical protein